MGSNPEEVTNKQARETNNDTVYTLDEPTDTCSLRNEAIKDATVGIIFLHTLKGEVQMVG